MWGWVDAVGCKCEYEHIGGVARKCRYGVLMPIGEGFMPLSRGHITLHGEEGNRDVLGSLWVSQTQVFCVRKR